MANAARTPLTREEADRQVHDAAHALQIYVNIADSSVSQLSCRCRCDTRVAVGRGPNGGGKVQDNLMRLYTTGNYCEFIICRWFFEGGCKTALMSAVFDEVTPMENSIQPGLDFCEGCGGFECIGGCGPC